MTRILVTGGSGGLGRRVLPLLRDDYDVRAMSRHARPDEQGVEWVRGDVVRDTGLAAAIEGADIVLHLAGGARGDETGARTVSAAASAAGVGHMVMISVIAADRMPIGYFRAKAAAERALADSGVPWTVLRAAQFHDFVDRAVRMLAAGPIAFAPNGLRFEPVDPDEVAGRLAALVAGRPSGRVPDLAGPEVLDADHLVRTRLASAGRRRRIVHPPLPGAVGRAYRDGDNLADATADRGARRWEDHLASERLTGQ